MRRTESRLKRSCLDGFCESNLPLLSEYGQPSCRNDRLRLATLKVRRCKLIQLQRIAGGEDQMVEVAKPLKEALNVLLIGEIKRVPFSFPIP
jgi:hypothetical protein